MHAIVQSDEELVRVAYSGARLQELQVAVECFRSASVIFAIVHLIGQRHAVATPRPCIGLRAEANSLQHILAQTEYVCGDPRLLPGNSHTGAKDQKGGSEASQGDVDRHHFLGDVIIDARVRLAVVGDGGLLQSRFALMQQVQVEDCLLQAIDQYASLQRVERSITAD